MDMKECYEQMGGGYEEILRRLGKEDRIRRFLSLFPKDGSFQTLEQAMADKNWNDAFRAAHTLKGVALNLSLSRLAASAVDLTESLRNGTPTDRTEEYYERVRQDYDVTIRTIETFLNQDA